MSNPATAGHGADGRLGITNREHLAAWLGALAERYRLVAPRQVGGELLYRPVGSSAEIVFEFQRTALSPKEALLPATEVILEVERHGREVQLREPGPERPQVVWGVRPCDARAMRALDALLLGRPPADMPYAGRRDGTTLIGLACPRLWPGCFCTSLGGGPDDASGVDLMLYEAGGEYVVRVMTDKGAVLLPGLALAEGGRTMPASDASAERVPVLEPAAWQALFDHPYWQRLADRCLSCHACTYVCPTCRCTDVRDTVDAAGPGYARARRLRAWDSCLAPGYRRIAGGHNPRPTKAQRLRNRYYCKFYTAPLRFGVLACVGCGRCGAVCPVGIDVEEMLADVAALGTGG